MLYDSVMRRAMSWAKIAGLFCIAMLSCYVLYYYNREDGYYRSQSVRIAELGKSRKLSAFCDSWRNSE